MNSFPSGLQILSWRRVAMESRWYISSWMFDWTLNLSPKFTSKLSPSDFCSTSKPLIWSHFSLGIFHAVRKSVIFSCSSPPHRSLQPPPPASVWQIPPNAPSWDTPGKAFPRWALSSQFWMQHLNTPQGRLFPAGCPLALCNMNALGDEFCDTIRTS